MKIDRFSTIQEGNVLHVIHFVYVKKFWTDLSRQSEDVLVWERIRPEFNFYNIPYLYFFGIPVYSVLIMLAWNFITAF
jgi:hypothetical protein